MSDSSDEALQRAIGRLEGQFEALVHRVGNEGAVTERRLTALGDKVQRVEGSLTEKINNVSTQLLDKMDGVANSVGQMQLADQRRRGWVEGGWRTIAIIFGSASAMLALLFSFLSWWSTEARGQEIETPWVRADTGNDFADFLIVVLILLLLAGLYVLIQRALRKGGGDNA